MAEMVFLTNLKPEPMGVHSTSKAYGINSLVMLEDGAAAYLSVKDVPAGTLLTNTEYWKIHTDLSPVKQRAEEATLKALAARDEMLEIARNLTDAVEAEGNPVQIRDLVGGLPFGSVVTVLEPKQAGSGVPAPGNVRAISGWAAANLTRCSKNLLKNTAVTQTKNGITYTINSDGTIICNGTSTATQAFTISNKMLPPGSYILTGCPAGGGGSAYKLQADIIMLDGTTKYISDFGSGVRFTVDETSKSMTVFIVVNKDGTHNNLTFSPMIRLADDDDATFEPYTGDAYSAGLGQTVYGGSFDWHTGLLTVDTAFVELDGSEPWMHLTDNVVAPYFYYAIGSFGSVVNSSAVSSHFVEADIASSNALTGIHVLNSNAAQAARILVRPDIDGVTNLSSWINYLQAQKAAGTPVQAAYKLTAPTTIQLTPQEIKQLQGANTLYGDGRIEVTGLQNPHPAMKARLEALERAVLNG